MGLSKQKQGRKRGTSLVVERDEGKFVKEYAPVIEGAPKRENNLCTQNKKGRKKTESNSNST